MVIIWNFIESMTGRGKIAALEQGIEQRDNTLDLFEERLAELELSLEDANFQRMSAEAQHEFSRAGLHRIAFICRMYWVKNPLVKRAVEIQQIYTFGQGVTIKAPAGPVDEVIQEFLSDPLNATELTGHQAMEEKEAELQIESNLFLSFFTDYKTGCVRVRSIPFREIEDTICNPDDRREVWFYRRHYFPMILSASGEQVAGPSRAALYPDWKYNPADRSDNLNGIPIRWEAPTYHIATNKLGDMKFGVPELYAAIDWAKAYNQFLEDWATIVRAYARFAWKGTTKGGAQGVAALKTKLDTTLTANSGVDRNPPPAAGSHWLGTQGETMEPMRTAGATTAAEDGRRLLLMVCAATGIYEHYFGDPSTGNLATSTSMERPMELKFLRRRRFWGEAFAPIFAFVIEAKVRAGKLAGDIVENGFGRQSAILRPDPEDEDKEPMEQTVNVDWPSLLDHSISERISALVSATTLDGKAPAGTIDLPTFTRMCLLELGADNVEEMIETLFPEGWEEDRAAQAADKAAAAQQAFTKRGEGDAPVAEALRELREAIARAYAA